MMNLDAEHNLANKFLGYTGEKSRPALDGFYKSNPGAAARMGEYSKAITGMAKGGYYGGYTGIPGGERGRTPPSVAPKQEVVRPKARPTPAPTPKPVSKPNVPTIRPRARPTEAQNISFASSYPEPKSITTFTDNSGATVAESTDSKTTTINRSSQSGDNLIRQAIELNVPIEFSENGQSASVSNATMEKLATSKFGIKSGMLMAEHKRRNPAGGYSSFHLGIGPEGNLNIFDPKNMDVTGGKMKVGYKSTFNQGGAVAAQLTPTNVVASRVPASEAVKLGMVGLHNTPNSGGGTEIKGNGAFVDHQDISHLVGSNEPSYNFTYEQAIARRQQRDVKSPPEQAAIDAAIARGPSSSQEEVTPKTLSYTGDIIPKFGGVLEQTMQPTQADVSYIAPTADQDIDPTAGQVSTTAPTAEVATVDTTAQATMPITAPAATYGAAAVAPEVGKVTAGMQPVEGEVSQEAQVTAAQQHESAVSGMQAAQGAANIMQNPVQREIQQGELVSGAADAQKAAQFTEQVQAATATPTSQATVQGQLEGLMQQFEGGATPAWAAGAMRNATAAMAARGLGASSMAGQALVQAAMESALPIAQADAQTVAQFEAQNLSNRQQRAMLAAQQRATFMGQEFDQAFQARVQNSARIGDIANMNFTAEQNIALENSRAVNTMNLANLGNRQAMVMAEAAALSQLDMSNLNNRQQAAVQNAQSFMQMDMTNVANAQQTALFKAQQNVQALFTDQAATNAAAQFNASSENQTNQFFSQLSSQTSQFNTAQANAMSQFNVDATNSIRQFNANLQNQRDQFNANNGLVVAQANAQWRQNIATLNTAAQNESNMNYAKTINSLTSSNLDQIWQRERDLMQYNFTTAESAKDRALSILMGDKELEALKNELGYKEDTAKTHLLFRFLFGSGETGFLG